MSNKGASRTGLIIVLIVFLILALSCSCLIGALVGGSAVGLMGYKSAETKELPREMPEGMGPLAPEPPRGRQVVMITGVVEGSPAERAGLRSGDVVLRADGQNLDELDTLYQIVSGKAPGDTLVLLILRNGRQAAVEVRLGQDPDKASQAWLGIEYRLIPSGRFQFRESD